ncbi:hypothetical protein [Collimonas sp.]|jgi:hypothetical protein|uniref:hypothetical protein n=1 Tax=Collimonas sp. TaxID=1963772 RepID=UPI002BDF71A2|nr:hypothetical protein [Collimonas sp.]HWX03749.1 hypothetical protein [Collimonas sp.]
MLIPSSLNCAQALDGLDYSKQNKFRYALNDRSSHIWFKKIHSNPSACRMALEAEGG